MTKPWQIRVPQEIKYANLLLFSQWCIMMQINLHVCLALSVAPHCLEGCIYRRKFRNQTSDNMDRWNSRGGKSQRGEEKEERRSERRKSEKEEDAGARKNRKVAIHCVCPMICGSRVSKSNLAKAAGCGAIWPDEKWKVARRCSAKHISKSKCAKHLSFGAVLEVAMSKKCTPLWREAHFQVKKDIRHHVRTTFGSWDGATKHISKSCTKHTNVGALLELEMSKKCTPVWREAHLQVKSVKNWRSQTTFESWDVEKLHAVVAFQVKMLKTPHARTTFWRADVEKSCTLLWREAHFQFRMHKAPDVRTTFDGWDVVLRGRRKGFCTLSKVSKRWRSCSSFNYNYNYNTLHYSRLHYTTLHYTTLHPTTLHYIALHYTTVHYTTLQYTTLHNTPPHYTTLHYTTPHSTTLHNTPLHSTPLQSTPLHYTPPHYTPLHYIALHYITLHYTTLNCTMLHCTYNYNHNYNYATLHYTTLH